MRGQRQGRRVWGWIAGLGVVAAILAAIVLSRGVWSRWLFDVTGEETLGGQVRGGIEWLGNLTRRQPQTADMVPVANAGMNPYGVNTFLEQEVEPAKRERTVQMIAEAGFHWIRQEFPWEDIEIHGKGDFEDRRNVPYRSAWDKYDNIVNLADQYGLELIVRLSNPPAWSRAKGDAAGSFAPPDNLADYGDFVATVASRYRGKVRYYQIWNEPNIYPEWGEQAVSPEAYTQLLKVGYTRIKEVCPECVVISGALAQTIPLGPRDMNDFVFLQRMYDAGAGSYFDVLAIQGYGLWSGPTDRRMRPRVLNFSRPPYFREMMVKNGDGAKPIWITEMNWNASPADMPDKPFGSVTLEQQARYAVLAYQRAQQEWPWVGVVSFWFFKRATDTEKDQPMYYFRMVEPDFTPLPVYDALKRQMQQPPVLYPGVHQEDDWALTYQGTWKEVADPSAELGSYKLADSPDSTLSLTFVGTALRIKPRPGEVATWLSTVDGGAEHQIHVGDPRAWLLYSLPPGKHNVQVRALNGSSLSVDSVIVEGKVSLWRWFALGGAVCLAGVVMVGLVVIIRAGGRRRPWYERGSGWK